ncbi:hypothetical protein BKE38_15660 [Pseudoroseomonas deserti]|uniref:Uncharacterized protein n=1 Tax=Teichococcus deserti TaxID=1817963 RepID=A0A1V2H0M0_9PROT|nr:hypothetical protein [Pseudoroseomonas deserti]ONG51801.1 hypothetical protein BKE38_15660 [Pseudoroseomonas deserti]
MIIWQGWGILTVLILGGVPAAGMAALFAVLGPKPAPLTFSIVVMLMVLLGGLANWWVGRRLNGGPGRELIDARTGQRVILRPRHSLFWIPMQYWSVLSLLAALGFGIAAAGQLGREAPRPPGGPTATSTPKAPPGTTERQI